MGGSWFPNNTRDVGPAAGLFPPQEREWGLPAEVPLTPHAARRLARALPAATALAEPLKDWLHDGPFERVLETLRGHAERVGPPQVGDGREHPRRRLTNTLDYFEKHRAHMDYPTYRKKGWPIGSGVTESGVKQFNKRVKGTEPFWTTRGAESILALRGRWLSQDGRWSRYWTTRPAYQCAA